MRNQQRCQPRKKFTSPCNRLNLQSHVLGTTGIGNQELAQGPKIKRGWDWEVGDYQRSKKRKTSSREIMLPIGACPKAFGQVTVTLDESQSGAG